MVRLKDDYNINLALSSFSLLDCKHITEAAMIDD